MRDKALLRHDTWKAPASILACEEVGMKHIFLTAMIMTAAAVAWREIRRVSRRCNAPLT